MLDRDYQILMFAKTPKPTYYAVIFSSIRTDEDNGYADMTKRMFELAKKQIGFLGIESVRDSLGLTVSYWKDSKTIKV